MKPLIAQAPSEDKRSRIVNATLRRHGYSPDALNEVLHSSKAAFGYLESPQIRTAKVPALLHVRPVHVVVKVNLSVPDCPPSAAGLPYVLRERLARRLPEVSAMTRSGA